MPYSLDEFADFAIRASKIIEAMNQQIENLKQENGALKKENEVLRKQIDGPSNDSSSS